LLLNLGENTDNVMRYESALIHFVDGRVADGIYELNEVIGSFKNDEVNGLVGKLAEDMKVYMPKAFETASRRIIGIYGAVIS